MIITVGGIKGGTGKSTIAFHLAVAAKKKGIEIVTVDTDYPQLSFTRYFENRKRNPHLDIWPTHYAMKEPGLPEFQNDKIYLIDTPGRYDEQTKHLHAIADIIITPINDSLTDIDTIMNIQNNKWVMPGHYCEMIFANKSTKKDSQWIMVRNRSSSINSKHKNFVEEKLKELSSKLNFVLMTGLKERTIFRELFSVGETVFDQKTKLSISQLAAKMEIKLLFKMIEERIRK